jgi:hypothetical protein
VDRKVIFLQQIQKLSQINRKINYFSFKVDLLKQERPAHVAGDMVYAGMMERGRAIPPHSIPIVERPGRPGGLPPRPGVIERRVRILFD